VIASKYVTVIPLDCAACLAESATPLAYVVLSCMIAILLALSQSFMKLTSAGASASSRLTMRKTLS